MSFSIKQRSPAFILVVVLGLILMMTWVTIEVLAAARRDMAVRRDPNLDYQQREVAYQALELAIAVLAEVRQFESALYAPHQGWGTPLALAGMEGPRRPPPSRTPQAAQRESAPQQEEAVSLLDELILETEAEEDRDNEGFEPRNQRPIEREFYTFSLPEEVTGGEEELRPITFPGNPDIRIRVLDETGKLSLRATTPERWRQFFEVLGFEEDTAGLLTDSLLDWMDPDEIARPQGAESEFYEQLDPPYRAANRPLRDFEELRLIQGFRDLFFQPDGSPEPVFAAFVDSVSLEHTGRVNLNTANRLVMETLAEEQNFELNRVLDFLAGPDMLFGTADDRILRPGLDPEAMPKDEDGEPIKHTVQVEMVQVIIEVELGFRLFTLQALLDLNQPHPGNLYPFKILRLWENKPLPPR